MTLLAADSVKERFSIIPNYFLNHAVGLLPHSSDEAVGEYLNTWKSKGADAWPQWLNALGTFGEELGKVLGCSGEEICPQVNVTTALIKIVGCLHPTTGKNRILLSRYDFPTIGFALSAFEQLKFTVEFIEDLIGEEWTEETLSTYLCDSVALLFVSHATYGSSKLREIPALARRCSELDIVCVVDIAQSIGIVPTPVRDWGVPFVVGTCTKWLCGGNGTGFLYASTTLASNRNPSDRGWFSHENPMEFDIRSFRYASTAWRFLGGTPSVLPFVIAGQSISKLYGIGFEVIFSHNRALTDRLKEGFAELGVETATPHTKERSGGTVTARLSKECFETFVSNDIRCDFRPGYGVRLSPHCYTSLPEVERVLELTESNYSSRSSAA